MSTGSEDWEKFRYKLTYKNVHTGARCKTDSHRPDNQTPDMQTPTINKPDCTTLISQVPVRPKAELWKTSK